MDFRALSNNEVTINVPFHPKILKSGALVSTQIESYKQLLIKMKSCHASLYLLSRGFYSTSMRSSGRNLMFDFSCVSQRIWCRSDDSGVRTTFWTMEVFGPTHRITLNRLYGLPMWKVTLAYLKTPMWFMEHYNGHYLNNQLMEAQSEIFTWLTQSIFQFLRYATLLVACYTSKFGWTMHRSMLYTNRLIWKRCFNQMDLIVQNNFWQNQFSSYRVDFCRSAILWT